jgi:predicted transcriptional regulator
MKFAGEEGALKLQIEVKVEATGGKWLVKSGLIRIQKESSRSMQQKTCVPQKRHITIKWATKAIKKQRL